MLTLVIGGSASGKSEYAESLVLAAGPGPRYYLATMEPMDGECHARIDRHRLMRAEKGFVTVERYTGLAGLTLPGPGGTVLLEDLGNLAANELYSPAGAGPEKALDAILDGLGLEGVDGMLFDLGVSSPQLDDGSRGFSYMADAPLDMRMDQSDGLTARIVVNEWPQEELRRILWQYGEERYSSAIAGAIVRAREKKPVETTLELVDIIKGAMPASALREKQHPAKRSFQAIRIAVNDELGSVDKMVRSAVPRLNPGGRLAVISFHSLEDRIVKKGWAEDAKGCTCPPDFPVCVCGKKPQIKLITRKPIVSGPEELEENPRARSAKLRVAEKLRER